MEPADRVPSTAPLPSELAALDFELFGACHAGTDAERGEHVGEHVGEDVGEHLVALTRLEVRLRIDIAAAARLATDAEAEYLAAESEGERRAWRERALLAESIAISATHDLQRVLAGRARALRSLTSTNDRVSGDRRARG